MCSSHTIWLTKYPNSPLQMTLNSFFIPGVIWPSQEYFWIGGLFSNHGFCSQTKLEIPLNCFPLHRTQCSLLPSVIFSSLASCCWSPHSTYDLPLTWILEAFLKNTGGRKTWGSSLAFGGEQINPRFKKHGKFSYKGDFPFESRHLIIALMPKVEIMWLLSRGCD